MKNIVAGIIALIVALIMTITACAKQTRVVEPRSSSMKFNKIEVTNNIHIIVEERTEGNFVISGEQSVVKDLNLTVRKNTLYASLNNNFLHNNGKSAIEIRIPNNGQLTEIECDGASHVKVVPLLTGNEIELEADGASKIEASVSANSVKLNCDGASVITSDIKANCAEVDCEGASVVNLTGKVQYADMEAEGACSIKARDFECTNMKAVAEGASKMEVFCTGKLQATCSGMSKISYRGECLVSNTSDYLSKVTRIE